MKNYFIRIKAFMEIQAAEEKNFHEIDLVMATHWKELPYNKAEGIIKTLGNVVAVFTAKKEPGILTEQDEKNIKKYYEICRRKFYKG